MMMMNKLDESIWSIEKVVFIGDELIDCTILKTFKEYSYASRYLDYLFNQHLTNGKGKIEKTDRKIIKNIGEKQIQLNLIEVNLYELHDK